MYFFLHLAEAKAYLNQEAQDFGYFKSLSHFRKNRWLLRRDQKPIAVIPPQGGDETQLIPNSLRAMSVGKAESKAIFLDEFSDLNKIPDEPFILVTRTANPVWISLFPKMKGWITEVGGPLAHGFVAAREWGIPVVSHYPVEVIRRLPASTLIHLDGGSGEVTWR